MLGAVPTARSAFNRQCAQHDRDGGGQCYGRYLHARVWTLCRIGIWQTKHRRTIPKISAQCGEPAMGGEGRAGVGLCTWVARCVVCDDGAQILGQSAGD